MPAKREREEINVDEVSESFGLSQTSQGDDDDFFEHQMQREVVGKFAQGERIFVCRKCYPTLSSGAFDQGKLVPLGRGFQGVFKAQNGQPAMSRHRKMHFEKSSPKVNEPRQTTLEEFTSRDETKKSDVAQLFSVLNLSFRCVENPVVRKALGPLLRSSGVAPNRKAVREVILCEAKNARRELVSRMRRCSVSLALDGGTIRRRTFINFTVGFAGSVHFWRTVKVASTKSSVIMALIAKEIEELAADEVYVISIVSDNAANMQCALKGLKEDSNSDDDSDTDDEQTEATAADIPLNALEADVRSFPRFLLFVRCWAHTFQLVMNDVFKKSTLIAQAFECVSRIVPILQRRACRTQLAAILAAKGSTLRTLVTPCVTRWNSYVRCMASLVDIVDSVNLAIPKDESPISENEKYAIQIALIVLIPITWATDEVQGDDVDVLGAMAALSRASEHLKFPETVNFESARVRNDARDAIGVATKALASRSEWLRNDVVKITESLDPQGTNQPFDSQRLVSEIQQYYVDRGIEIDVAAIGNALVEFQLRSEADKKIPMKEYWSRRSVQFPAVSHFVRETLQLLQTEASVERTFMRQDRIFAPERWRMDDEILNAQMFLAGAADSTTPQRPKTANIMNLTKWREYVVTLCEPIASEGMRTRKVAKHELGMSLKIGQRVRVAWENEAGEMQNYFGTIVAKSGVASYSVVYDGLKKFFDFQPNDKDKDGDWSLHED